MNKYIVRNCPAYQKELVTMDFKTGETIITDKNYCINPFLPNACQDRTDCVMKKIVALCNAYDFSMGLSEEILDLLEIEECE